MPVQILPQETDPTTFDFQNQDIAVSIVVPIYNVEDHLGECLNSLVNQTLSDIEILCYDDASTDSSGRIAAQFAERDPRVKLTRYPDNRSASQARKDGALAARGKYLMFVDADDYLELDACAILVRKISDLDVDILQFGTNIVSPSPDTARIEQLQKLLAPLEQRLTENAPFSQCFLENAYGYTIWNKIYRADFAKRAFADIPDGCYPKAQDVFAYFVLAWHARSYEGIPDRFYNYRFGAGITGVEEVSLERLAVFAKQALVADAIDHFVSQHEGSVEQHQAADRIRQRLAADCVNQWFRRTAPEDAAQGFDILAEAWPVEDVAAALHRQFHKQRQYFAPRIRGAKLLARRETTLATGGTLGIFYHRLSIGGVQRVLSILVPMYLRMGYRVVMLLDEEHNGDGFEFPTEVRQIVLPPAGTDYRPRGERLREIVQEEQFDGFLYEAGSSPILLYDLLVVKAEGVPFIVSVHDSAFHSLLHSSGELATRPQVLKLADVVQVLSEAEEAYWSSQGVNAVFIPNPVTTELVDETELDVQPGMLLWIGRLDIWVKRCLDAVRAMAIVVRSRPDARLYMVGKEWTPESGVRIRQEIQQLGLEEKIILCDSTPDVQQYYGKADAVVITSVTESSSMAVVEAKAFGVPIAMYSLPHLDTLRDGKGFLAVPQGDIAGLARTIISILNDRDLRQKLSQDGRESLADLASVDLEAKWRVLFERATRTEPFEMKPGLEPAVVGSLISNALDIYTLGVQRRQEETAAKNHSIRELRTGLKAAQSRTKSAGARTARSRKRALAKRKEVRRKRIRQLMAFVCVTGVVAAALLICTLLAQWQAAAVLALVLLGLLSGAGAIAYLHLLRRHAASERRVARIVRSEQARLEKLVRVSRVSQIKSRREILDQLQALGAIAQTLSDATRSAEASTRKSVGELSAIQSERWTSLADQIGSISKTVAEASWATVYADTSRQSQWYRDRSVSPGRWAVGYPLLYVLYRVLNELHPESILELGLGQSTKMIAQYAAHFQPHAQHIVVEHDPEWAHTLTRSFELPPSSELVQLDLVQSTYHDGSEVIEYSDFAGSVGDRKYDLICIDGPFGGKAERFARVDVLSILPDSLSEDFVILLDDHDRLGERNTAREIRGALHRAGIKHHWGEYSGEKSVLVITSAKWRFLTSM